jgi:hypothetical protein
MTHMEVGNADYAGRSHLPMRLRHLCVHAHQVDVGVEHGSEAVDKTHRTSASDLSEFRLQAALDLIEKYA